MVISVVWYNRNINVSCTVVINSTSDIMNVHFQFTSQEQLPQVKCPYPYEAPDQCAAGAGALIGNAVIITGLLVLMVLLL